MLRRAWVTIAVAGCGSAPKPAPPIAPPVAAPIVRDAAMPSVADAAPIAQLAPPPDAARSVSDLLADLPRSPTPLAGTDAAAVTAYVAAAAQLLATDAPHAYAMLVEVARVPACDPCRGAIVATRHDDAWRTEWDQPRYDAVLVTASMSDAAHADGSSTHPELVCPRGTKLRGTWGNDEQREQWCAKPNGVRHGPYRYYQSYQVAENSRGASGTYVDGIRDGHWEEYGWYDEAATGNYVHGVRDGAFTLAYRDGTVYATYVHGRKVGTATKWNGHILEDRHYVADKLDGAYRAWSEKTGKLATTGAYVADGKTGTWSTYDDAGHIVERDVYDHGVPWGTFETFDATGKRVRVIALDHGNGAWSSVDANGAITAGALVDGLRDGAWYEPDDSHATRRGSYRAGKREGVWTSRDGVGNRIVEGRYAAGERTGTWTYWRSDNTRLATGDFAAGKLTGTWIVYDEHGTDTAQRLTFRADTLVSVDGKRAARAYQNAFNASAFASHPAVLEQDVDNRKTTLPPRY